MFSFEIPIHYFISLFPKSIFLNNLHNFFHDFSNLVHFILNLPFLFYLHNNKIKSRTAQLINSGKPWSYLEIKQLLNLYFGDSRVLSSFIQDLPRLKQLSNNKSPLIFYNRLQVIIAKLHANIQKTSLLNAD